MRWISCLRLFSQVSVVFLPKHGETNSIELEGNAAKESRVVIFLVEESAEKPKEEIAKVAKWVQVPLKGESFSLCIFLVSFFY